MNILVVNDDGYEAPGIHILASKLKRFGNVTVVGPDGGRSATGHGIVLHGTLSFEFVREEDGIKWYKTSGTPADCTRLGLALFEEEFDIVFSGVNNGLNVGTDIIYSGTVAGAREAQIEDVASVAISTDFGCFDIVNKEIDAVLDLVFDKKLYSKEYVLNINFPTCNFKESKGIKVCRQGIKNFKTKFVKNEEGRYINQDDIIIYDQNPGTDVYEGLNGYTTIVPLKVSQSDADSIEKINNLLKK